MRAASHGNQAGGLLAEGRRGKKPRAARIAQRGTAALRGKQGTDSSMHSLGLCGKYGKMWENRGRGPALSVSAVAMAEARGPPRLPWQRSGRSSRPGVREESGA